MSKRIVGYKVFTHDLRPPIQGGDRVWDGSTPYLLPRVTCDESNTQCGAGWNFCRSAADAFRLCGFWRGDGPVRLFEVAQNGSPIIHRGDKSRSASLVIVREAGEHIIGSAVAELSAQWFRGSDPGVIAAMVEEQLAWLRALRSGDRDAEIVEMALLAALEARGLNWTLRRFDSAGAARAAGAAWDAGAARAAGAAWDAGAARAAGAAWDAWAAWAAWAARDAWAAGAALTVQYASRRKWTRHNPELLTVGIRDAYAYGLAVAIPTGPNELGWAMKPEVV